jgi:hypothetical protein
MPVLTISQRLTPPERRRFRRAMYRYWTFCEQWKRGGTFGDFVQLLDINDVLEMVGAARFLRDMAEIMFYDYAGPCIFSGKFLQHNQSALAKRSQRTTRKPWLRDLHSSSTCGR